MTIGERIEQRRIAIGIESQSELARRAGVGQSTLNGLIRKPYRSSPYLTKIARELRTTVEYLSGDVDDPDEGASPPPPVPRHQPLMLPVMLPAEAALEAAFLGVLLASEKMDQRELARELAKRLPTVLRLSSTATIEPALASDDDLLEPDEPLADALRERRRA